MTAVLATAVWDLLVNERARFRAVLELLETKGLVSSAEVEAIQSTRPLSPKEAENESQTLVRALQGRMTARSQQLALSSDGLARRIARNVVIQSSVRRRLHI